MYRAVNPWAGSMMAMNKVRSEGSRFFKMDSRSDALYKHAEKSAFAIRQKRLDDALPEIAAGMEADPANPLFDYLRAVVLWRKGDEQSAFKFIAGGNEKGALRVYPTGTVLPDRWQWREIAVIGRLARDIAKEQPTSKGPLSLALRMADKLVWSEPPYWVNVLEGISAREEVARRLVEVAVKQQDNDLQKVCWSATQEGKVFRLAVRREFANDDEPDAGSRAFTITRAIQSDDPRFWQAAMLVVMDKQAEWTDTYRKKYMTRKLIEDYPW